MTIDHSILHSIWRLAIVCLLPLSLTAAPPMKDKMANPLVEAAIPVDLAKYKDKPCKLFILGGQSNMDGCGRSNELPRKYQKHPESIIIWDHHKSKWFPLTQDTTAIVRNQLFGPEIAFGHKLAEA